MLTKIFLQILNMSFTGSVIILFVLLARLILQRSPKGFSYALWSVVLFRLSCPFSFESFMSLLPTNPNPISQNIVYMQTPKINTGIAAFNHTVNPLLPAATPYASINPLQFYIFIGSLLWLLGIVALLAYSLITLMSLKKHLQNATLYKENIFISQNIDTAFVMGIVHPRIYLPESLNKSEREYILLHEQTHIKRFDHIVKLISFLMLCVHWFNPLVWIAFFYSCKDMEMSCDEAVIKQLGNEVKKDYSSSLLTLATGNRIIGGTPLAFGEGDTKGRIQNVLNYRKPAFWVGIISLIAVVVIGIGLMTNPLNTVLFMEADKISNVHLIDKTLYGTMLSDDKVLDISTAKVSEITDFIKQLKVQKREVSQSRDEGRDATHQIHLVIEGYQGSAKTNNLYFNFSSNFSEIWLDNEIKPTFSYAIDDPKAAKAFFERQFSSVTQAVQISSAEELWKARTPYVGDNSAVGNLIYLLPIPDDLQYDHFELNTSSQPYGISIIFNTDSETRTYYTGLLHQVPFQRNAMLLFALINNVDQVNFILNDGQNTFSQSYQRDWANDFIHTDIRNYAESSKKLQELIDFTMNQMISETIPYEYSMMKLGKNGEMTSDHSINNDPLAEAILMNVLVKSAAWEGVDINTLEECFLIRQTFTETQEIQDYYAYLLDGKAVLQFGRNGRYSSLSADLYAQLVDLFDSTNGLSFWVKPDEPPQVIGNTAATIWLKSFIDPQIPVESRISDFVISDVTVIAGEPKAGVKWEDMAYQYVVRLTYDITTADEQYRSPGDGVAGKGTFHNLFRELSVKVKLEDGRGYQIVAVGTGGAEQEFAQ